MKKFVFAFATLALAAASAAAHYTVELVAPAQLNGQVLQAGTYKMELNGNHAVLKSGKVSVQADARVENEDKKFFETSIRFASEGPNPKIQEIRIGGTTTKVVFTNQTSGN
ncbi:MAG TPA: hypothetical protein VGL53_16785 [Bryobacteraceae bacterium]|jgi:hypothetical protein